MENYIEKLKQMVNADTYKELLEKLTDNLTNEKVAQSMLPQIAKTLVEGGREEREAILIDWLDMDSCRVCTTCGKIMSEGWYLNNMGYACSDECAAKSEGITMEQFEKWRIYKDDIEQYLRESGDKRSIDELTADECADIINEKIGFEDLEYYWTEW